MEKILVVLPVDEMQRQKLREAAPDAEFVFENQETVSEGQVKEASVILGNVPPEYLQGSVNLRWLQLNSAGTDGYTSPGILPAGAQLTNASGAYGLAISEHMLGLLLCLMKRFPAYLEDQNAHRWSDHGTVASIWNSTVLVVGLGDIGGEFARRMHALGSRVIGIRKHVSEKPEYLDGLYPMEELERWLSEADIVAASLPGTRETYHLFRQETFRKMKRGAYFLNVGRGTAVDSEALAEALRSGHLAGAGIDVTEPEPLPSDHPLWEADNLIITPHVSGGYHLPETLERIVQISADNLKRFLRGEELQNEVDFETGYRKSIRQYGRKR